MKTIREEKVADAIVRLVELPGGGTLASVLKAIASELGGARVQISNDLHRALVRLEGGKLVTVRVTTAKLSATGVPTVRFKPPRDVSMYEMMYFGGLDAQGRGVVHRLKPNDIGQRRTLTLRCGPVKSS